jgi:RNA 2',3'-cyclic 3'-phosphodiesterase
VRVFTALYPSSAAVADLERVVDPLRSAHADLTWTHAEQWHLTLPFHADIGADQVRRLERTVARCAAIRDATSARFRGGGAFPSRTQGRILWVGVEPADRALADLQRNLTARLRRQGWPLEERRYRPHLTLARSRVRRDFGAMVDELDAYAGPSWDVDRIAIVASRPDQGRHVHERIGDYPLRGAVQGD